jgi:hypothetical protein
MDNQIQVNVHLLVKMNAIKILNDLETFISN